MLPRETSAARAIHAPPKCRISLESSHAASARLAMAAAQRLPDGVPELGSLRLAIRTVYVRPRPVLSGDSTQGQTSVGPTRVDADDTKEPRATGHEDGDVHDVQPPTYDRTRHLIQSRQARPARPLLIAAPEDGSITSVGLDDERLRALGVARN